MTSHRWITPSRISSSSLHLSRDSLSGKASRGTSIPYRQWYSTPARFESLHVVAYRWNGSSHHSMSLRVPSPCEAVHFGTAVPRVTPLAVLCLASRVGTKGGGRHDKPRRLAWGSFIQHTRADTKLASYRSSNLHDMTGNYRHCQ